jgi:uncharacterized protein YbcI
MQRKFIEVIERLTGREVLNFISDSHVGPDVEIEVFILGPVGRVKDALEG